MSEVKETADETGSKVPWRLVFGLGLAAVVSSAYLAFRPPTLPKSGLNFEPKVEHRLKMEQLKSQLSAKHRRFALQDVKARTNAELFTYMAGTSADPLVLEASLDAIQHAYSSRSDNKARPDADLEKVLLQKAESPTPQIATLAFQALRIPVMTESPRPELVAALCDLFRSAEPGPRRLALLETLNLLGPEARTERALASFRAALESPEPYLISTGLLALTSSLAALQHAPTSLKAEIDQRALELTRHADPGVRGRALHLLAQNLLAQPDDELHAHDVWDKSVQLLGDTSGYVRAEAAEALGRARHPVHIRTLVSLVRDLAPTQYDLTGWQRLDGSPGVLLHATPGRRRVADAALFALRQLSSSLGPDVPRLELVLNGPVLSEEDLAANAERAEKWADDVASKLSKPSDPASGQHSR